MNLIYGMRQVGLRGEVLTVPRIWSGIPEQLWAYQQEIGTLCHPPLDSIPPDSHPNDAQVVAALSIFQVDNRLNVPVNVTVVAGTALNGTEIHTRARFQTSG